MHSESESEFSFNEVDDTPHLLNNTVINEVVLSSKRRTRWQSSLLLRRGTKPYLSYYSTTPLKRFQTWLYIPQMTLNVYISP